MQRIKGLTKGLIGAAALSLATAGAVLAQDDARTKPVFDAKFAVADILNAAKTNGKGLVVVLGDGVTYVGKVKQVGAHAVILTGLQGKELFDAYVPLRSIVALEEQMPWCAVTWERLQEP